jgi:hypothetical protein
VQNFTLHVKIKQVDDQLFNSKVLFLQKDLYMKLIEKKSPLESRTKIINHVYNQRFKKYLDYRSIQQSIIWNVRSRIFKKVGDQLGNINHLYRFLFTTYTSIENVDLVWEDFAILYIFIYSIITLCEHAIDTFPNLLFFLDSWVVFMKEKGILLVGLQHAHTTTSTKVGCSSLA